MIRLAEHLPHCVSIAYPGLRPEKEKVTKLIAKFESLELGSSDMMVLDLISNVAYIRTDDSGLPSGRAMIL
jgi:hypothetical protein